MHGELVAEAVGVLAEEALGLLRHVLEVLVARAQHLEARDGVDQLGSRARV
jgi:hypothetical protein